MKNIISATSLILCMFFSTSLYAEKTVKETTMEMSNKEKAVLLIESLETGDKKPVSYINPKKYIQHNLMVADGLEGFAEVLKHAPATGFKAEVIRAYQDNEYVFLHTKYDFFGPKVGFDVFRFEDGLIVEHWDNLIEIAPANPSGHTQIDGPTKSEDLNATEKNKKMVENFVSTILVQGKMEKIGDFINPKTEDYIQHNPAVGDGLSGLNKAFKGMAEQGITMVYSKVHKVLGEGNFVLVISEGTFANKATSFYDLFRVENDKIVEHWDVIEPILPKAEWKNSNGKFNF